MEIPSTAADAPTGKKKAKFPWGTVFLTGVVTTIGAVVAMKMIDAAKSKRAGDDDLNARRDTLLNPSSIGALPQAVQPVADPRMLVVSEKVLLQLAQGQVH